LAIRSIADDLQNIVGNHRSFRHRIELFERDFTANYANYRWEVTR
jgi:hypothetical protein